MLDVGDLDEVMQVSSRMSRTTSNLGDDGLVLAVPFALVFGFYLLLNVVTVDVEDVTPPLTATAEAEDELPLLRECRNLSTH